jgi:hypothetical protein
VIDNASFDLDNKIRKSGGAEIRIKFKKRARFKTKPLASEFSKEFNSSNIEAVLAPSWGGGAANEVRRKGGASLKIQGGGSSLA